MFATIDLSEGALSDDSVILTAISKLRLLSPSERNHEFNTGSAVDSPVDIVEEWVVKTVGGSYFANRIKNLHRDFSRPVARNFSAMESMRLEIVPGIVTNILTYRMISIALALLDITDEVATEIAISALKSPPSGSALERIPSAKRLPVAGLLNSSDLAEPSEDKKIKSGEMKPVEPPLMNSLSATYIRAMKYTPVADQNTVAEILHYMDSLSEGLTSTGYSFCHSEEYRTIPLMGRAGVLNEVKFAWNDRLRTFTSSGSDRTMYKLPVCVGVPGVGKTRILEEWKAIFQDMQIPTDKNCLGLLVLYYNGHGLRETENKLPIEVTFSWRLLHRYFLERIVPFEVFIELLSAHPLCRVLTLRHAVEAICERFSSTDPTWAPTSPLSIYIGVDEFQAIPTKLVGESKITYIEHLIDRLVETSQALSIMNIHLYPMFAGTEWGKLVGLGLSGPIIRKIAIPFLTVRQRLSIAGHVYPKGIRCENFKRCLLKIGDIARNAVEFSTTIKTLPEAPSNEQMTACCGSIEVSNGNQWFHIPHKSLVILAAFCLSGVPISESDVPSPPIEMDSLLGNHGGQISWQQLADRGLINIVVRDGDSYPILPIGAMRKVVGIQPPHEREGVSSFESAFLCALKHALDLLFLDLDIVQPWQKWEQFGAYFYCIRINALLILGFKTASIGVLFRGARSIDSLAIVDCELALRPAKVLYGEEELSTESNLSKVHERGNTTRTVDLLHDPCCYIVVNGENGKAADIYFILREATVFTSTTGTHDASGNSSTCPSGRAFLFVDQRKRDYRGALTTTSIQKYCDAMYAVSPPSCSGAPLVVVTSIFSALADFGKSGVVTIPSNCFVFTKSNLRIYHASLADSPTATALLLDIHTSPAAHLEQVLGSSLKSKETIGLIKSLTVERTFLSFNELNEELRKHGHEPIDEALRGEFFFIKDYERGFVAYNASAGGEGAKKRKRDEIGDRDDPESI